MPRFLESGAVTSLLLLLIAGYAAILLNLYFNQAGMLYLPKYPGASSDATPASAGLNYNPVSLTTADGLHLDAWYLPAVNELGFSSLIFDYRGYGRSEGKPTEQGTYHDAEAAWQYLLSQGYAESEIIIMGRSLGASVAAELAHRHRPKAVVLESSFTSVPNVAADLYPLLPVRWLSRFSYNTLDYLPSITAPVLIVHSRDDEIIPFSHGQGLFAAANPPK